MNSVEMETRELVKNFPDQTPAGTIFRDSLGGFWLIASLEGVKICVSLSNGDSVTVARWNYRISVMPVGSKIILTVVK